MPTYARARAFLGEKQGGQRSFESNTRKTFSAHAHIFERMVARVYACKRVHMLPAAFFLLRSLSQTCLISVGVCEDTTEGRTKKVKLLQGCFFIDPFLS